ncbi:MAG TPA: lipid IV(A) 3-deoxy-D-manno-octulosonic acid transferase [Gammaproteobacteria bacterium]|nr:lipid IV(A) 3-deoxy-D-manno-octulosonic acid transferase [Gammaproteobacteria bacterium]
MMRRLYSIFFYLLLPAAFLRLFWRGRKAPAYRRRWAERLGWVPAMPGERPIWLHAVSVGETLAAVPLVRALQSRYPETPLLLTTTTPTGSERVRATFGDSVHHVYAPYDLPSVVQRFLNRTRPQLVVVMETELWPNLFHALRARGIPLLVVNARLSPRSTRGYQRLGRLTRATIGCIDTIAAQSPADAERYAVLGATAQQLVTTGNIKFDMTLPDDLAQAGQALRTGFGAQRPVWIAASTHEGEDEQVLAAHRQLLHRYPDLLLILVPRHPERFERVAVLCREQGFQLARRSYGETGADAQVYLGDTMGELMRMYAAADVAFVGGSLVPTGGHNLLEPAALGLAPLSGPHLFNFQQIAELLAAVETLTLVADAAALAAQVERLLAEPAMRRAAGERARQVVEDNRGALARTLDLIALRLSAEVAGARPAAQE